MRPWSWFSWDFDGAFDTQESNLRTFNTQAQFSEEEIYTFGVDYRYARDARDKVAADLVVFPESRWSARVYGRMDIEESFVEEHSYYVIHRTRCLGLGLGLRIRPTDVEGKDDDYTVWFRVWPLAFPNFSSSLGG